MTDDQVIEFLIRMTTHIAELHGRRRQPAHSNAGENFDDTSIPWMDEDFAAWMGARGPEAQQQACAWDPSDVAAERFTRREARRGAIARENRELWAFLYSLRQELDRRCSSRS